MNDITNGTFEAVGSLFLWLNVLKLRRDREVKGIHWGSVVFFFAWGVWNLHYYPALGQWWSFAGGLMIVTANLAWLVLVLFSKNLRKVN